MYEFLKYICLSQLISIAGSMNSDNNVEASHIYVEKTDSLRGDFFEGSHKHSNEQESQLDRSSEIKKWKKRFMEQYESDFSGKIKDFGFAKEINNADHIHEIEKFNVSGCQEREEVKNTGGKKDNKVDLCYLHENNFTERIVSENQTAFEEENNVAQVQDGNVFDKISEIQEDEDSTYQKKNEILEVEALSGNTEAEKTTTFYEEQDSPIPNSPFKIQIAAPEDNCMFRKVMSGLYNKFVARPKKSYNKVVLQSDKQNKNVKESSKEVISEEVDESKGLNGTDSNDKPVNDALIIAEKTTTEQKDSGFLSPLTQKVVKYFAENIDLSSCDLKVPWGENGGVENEKKENVDAELVQEFDGAADIGAQEILEKDNVVNAQPHDSKFEDNPEKSMREPEGLEIGKLPRNQTIDSKEEINNICCKSETKCIEIPNIEKENRQNIVHGDESSSENVISPIKKSKQADQNPRNIMKTVDDMSSDEISEFEARFKIWEHVVDLIEFAWEFCGDLSNTIEFCELVEMRMNSGLKIPAEIKRMFHNIFPYRDQIISIYQNQFGPIYTELEKKRSQIAARNTNIWIYKDLDHVMALFQSRYLLYIRSIPIWERLHSSQFIIRNYHLELKINSMILNDRDFCVRMDSNQLKDEHRENARYLCHNRMMEELCSEHSDSAKYETEDEESKLLNTISEKTHPAENVITIATNHSILDEYSNPQFLDNAPKNNAIGDKRIDTIDLRIKSLCGQDLIKSIGKTSFFTRFELESFIMICEYSYGGITSGTYNSDISNAGTLSLSSESEPDEPIDTLVSDTRLKKSQKLYKKTKTDHECSNEESNIETEFEKVPFADKCEKLKYRSSENLSREQSPNNSYIYDEMNKVHPESISNVHFTTKSNETTGSEFCFDESMKEWIHGAVFQIARNHVKLKIGNKKNKNNYFRIVLHFLNYKAKKDPKKPENTSDNSSKVDESVITDNKQVRSKNLNAEIQIFIYKNYTKEFMLSVINNQCSKILNLVFSRIEIEAYKHRWDGKKTKESVCLCHSKSFKNPLNHECAQKIELQRGLTKMKEIAQSIKSVSQDKKKSGSKSMQSENKQDEGVFDEFALKKKNSTNKKRNRKKYKFDSLSKSLIENEKMSAEEATPFKNSVNVECTNSSEMTSNLLKVQDEALLVDDLALLKTYESSDFTIETAKETLKFNTRLLNDNTNRKQTNNPERRADDKVKTSDLPENTVSATKSSDFTSSLETEDITCCESMCKNIVDAEISKPISQNASINENQCTTMKHKDIVQKETIKNSKLQLEAFSNNEADMDDSEKVEEDCMSEFIKASKSTKKINRAETLFPSLESSKALLSTSIKRQIQTGKTCQSSNKQILSKQRVRLDLKSTTNIQSTLENKAIKKNQCYKSFDKKLPIQPKENLRDHQNHHQEYPYCQKKHPYNRSITNKYVCANSDCESPGISNSSRKQVFESQKEKPKNMINEETARNQEHLDSFRSSGVSSNNGLDPHASISISSYSDKVKMPKRRSLANSTENTRLTKYVPNNTPFLDDLKRNREEPLDNHKNPRRPVSFHKILSGKNFAAKSHCEYLKEDYVSLQNYSEHLKNNSNAVDRPANFEQKITQTPTFSLRKIAQDAICEESLNKIDTLLTENKEKEQFYFQKLNRNNNPHYSIARHDKNDTMYHQEDSHVGQIYPCENHDKRFGDFTDSDTTIREIMGQKSACREFDISQNTFEGIRRTDVGDCPQYLQNRKTSTCTSIQQLYNNSYRGSQKSSLNGRRLEYGILNDDFSSLTLETHEDPHILPIPEFNLFSGGQPTAPYLEQLRQLSNLCSVNERDEALARNFLDSQFLEGLEIANDLNAQRY